MNSVIWTLFFVISSGPRAASVIDHKDVSSKEACKKAMISLYHEHTDYADTKDTVPYCISSDGEVIKVDLPKTHNSHVNLYEE